MARIHTMDKQSCISNQLWIGYSNKTLTRAVADFVNDHASKCEVCADIKEGIEELEQPGSLGQRVTLINKKVDEFLEPKRNLKLFWYWSAAAVLVFGVGLSWFLVSETTQIARKPEGPKSISGISKEKPVLQNETNPVISSPELKDIPLAKNDNPVFGENTVFDANIREDQVQQNADGRSAESMDNLEKYPETFKTPDTTSYALTQADTVVRGATMAFENNGGGTYSAAPSYNWTASEPEMKKVQTSDIAVVEVQTSSKRKSETSKRKSPTNPAPLNNNSNSTNPGITDNFSLSTYYVTKDSTDLALAYTNFDLANFAKCVETLKSITASPNSMYYEEGLMLKAKALIKQNKTKEAKAVLNTVVSLKGVWKVEAEGVLKGLK